MTRLSRATRPVVAGSEGPRKGPLGGDHRRAGQVLPTHGWWTLAILGIAELWKPCIPAEFHATLPFSEELR